MSEDTSSEGSVHHIFCQHQVVSTKVQLFLSKYDPGHLSAFELRGLFGRLSIEVQEALGRGDLATIPAARRLIQFLHEAWPWAGFFLDLKRPLGPARTVGGLPILAYGLCLTDLQLAAWDRLGKCTLRLDERQLQLFRRQCFGAINALGKRAEIPAEVLAGRRDAVEQQLNYLITCR